MKTAGGMVSHPTERLWPDRGPLFSHRNNIKGHVKLLKKLKKQNLNYSIVPLANIWKMTIYDTEKGVPQCHLLDVPQLLLCHTPMQFVNVTLTL